MATKNLEKYYEHRPVADLTELAAVSTVGMVNGVIVQVGASGFFQLQIPAVATPDGRDVIAGNGGGVWLRQTLAALETTVGGAIAIASGGTGAITQQAALNSIAGAVTDALFLRGDGANVSMSAIQVADVPTLNQNTTGTAGNVTGIVAIANGGTGQATQQAALDSIAGAVTGGQYLRGDGANVAMSAIQVADVPTLNQNTTGTAAKATNVSGGAANKIPYQTNVGVTGFVNANANAVLRTDGSNIPTLSTTLPAVEAGVCTCTDPSTSGSNSINTALLNVYNHAVEPTLTHTVSQKTLFTLGPAYDTWQDTGVPITLNEGTYLINLHAGGTITVDDQPAILNQFGIWMCLMKDGTELVQHEVSVVTKVEAFGVIFSSSSGNAGLSLIVDVASDGTLYKVMTKATYTTGWNTLQLSLSDIDINAVKIG